MTTTAQTCVVGTTAAVDQRGVEEYFIPGVGNLVATDLTLAETVTVYTVNLNSTYTQIAQLNASSPTVNFTGPMRITVQKSATVGACAVELWSL